MDMTRVIEQIKQAHMNSSDPPPDYKCNLCHDNGWIESRDENGIRFVKKCACQIARESEEKLKRSGLEQALTSKTFETFKVETDVQRMLQKAAKDFLDAYMTEEKKPWLYIGGNPGSGKTHVCTALCGELLKKNIGVRYMQWVVEARRLKAAVNDEEFEDLIEDYVNVPVLYIDDLLKQKYTENPVFTDADIKIAFSILDRRTLQNKATIISTEWDLFKQLLAADEGAFSRVFERCKNHTVYVPRNPRNNYRLTN